jgi:predicted ATPase
MRAVSARGSLAWYLDDATMITQIEALNFRCLHHVRQTLGRFHVLVGPNASGKTTFLDIVSFLGDLVTHGPEEAIRARTQNFVDLLWGRQGESFQVAIEARLPERLIASGSDRDTIRYEVQIGHDAARNELGIWTETVRLKSSEAHAPPQVSLFPALREVPETILQPVDQQGTQVVVTKDRGGTDNFYAEILTDMGGKGGIPAFKLGPRRSALANLPGDETRFPAATWLKALLSGGVEKMVLDSQAMRRASPPGQSRAFKTDGSNLPWVVETLQTRDPGRFGDWIAHLQTALPDLEGIRTVERPDDRHRYLMLRYRGGLEVPSWTASDGTLRLLALTLLAYIPDLEGVYLIEEPENGVHPRAVETMYQSLSNVYDAQVLLATHSPIILSLVEPQQLLCFAKASDGATDIVLGTQHPTLKDWQGETSLATLFAAGVLG